MSSVNYWPKSLDARDFDPESRQIIRMEEHLRILDLKVKALEENKTK